MRLFSNVSSKCWCLAAAVILVIVILVSENKEQTPPGADLQAEEFYTVSKIDLLEAADENAQEISLNDQEQVLEINEGGDYVLTGALNGRLEIDAPDEIVHLILDNVEINSYDGPAIYGKAAGKLVITIPEGSTAILQDSTYYEQNKDSQACLFSSCDLTINGRGSLQVYGYYKDGIRTKDEVKLLGPSILIKAKDTALRGNEGVAVKTQYLEIQSEKIGIYTKKENKGYVELGTGNISIIGGEYGIDAAQDVWIHDCLAALMGIIQDINCQGELVIEEGCLVN